jgi:hypothetical protein
VDLRAAQLWSGRSIVSGIPLDNESEAFRHVCATPLLDECARVTGFVLHHRGAQVGVEPSEQLTAEFGGVIAAK